MTPRNVLFSVGLFAIFSGEIVAAPRLVLDQVRRSPTATVVDGRIYVIGGFGNGQHVTTMEIIDPVAREISTREVSFTRLQHTAVVHDGRILLIGGYTVDGGDESSGYAAEVLSVDPATGDTFVLTTLPEPRAMSACVILEDVLYVIGGAAAGVGRGRSSRMEKLSLTDQTWQRGPDMPTAREAEAVVVDGKIIVAGGYDGDVPLSVVEAYDPVTDEWSTLPPLAASQSTHRGFVDGDDVFFFGDYQSLTRVTVGNPLTGTWRLLDAGLAPSRHAAAVRVGDTAWVIGGQGRSARDSRWEIQELDLAALRSAPILPAPNESHLIDQRRRAEAQRSIEPRLKALGSIAVLGTLEVSYQAEGKTWETQSPFRFHYDGRERFLVEFDDLTVVSTTNEIITVDARAKTFQHITNGNLQSVANIYSETRALPPGYGFLLSLVENPSFPWSHAYRLEEMSGEGSWLGRPTWTFTRSAAVHPGPGYGYLPSRIEIDQATGLTVVMEATAALGDPVMDCDRTGETVSRTLSYRFSVDHLAIDVPSNDSVFEVSLPEGDGWESITHHRFNPSHPWRLSHIHHAIDQARRALSLASWAERSPFQLNWSSEDCWGDQASPHHRAMSLSRMPIAFTPPFLTLNGPNGILAVNVEDGELAHTWPLSSFADPTNLFRNSRFEVLRGPGETGPILVVIHEGENRDARNERTFQLTAYKPGGEIAWKTTYRTSSNFASVRIFPRGGERGDALLLLHYEEMILIDELGQLRMKERIGTDVERLMVDESKDTGAGELIVFGRRIEAYGWLDD